ncbi:hypothetical protein EAH79_01630 [Sphingomonas koreensis]|nr:hypothetical protein EAH79_01630 [Sphingomonas koreensis]
MFEFKLEREIPLLTVTRTGIWSLETVAEYEPALRRELAALHRWGSSTAFIIDIRFTGAQPSEVAEALRAMVGRLGELHATRTAVVSDAGVAKLQARRVADASAQVFTSMVMARDWAMRRGEPTVSGNVVYNEPSDVETEGHTVRVHGPSDVDVSMTPGAALETAKRIGDAALEALLGVTHVPGNPLQI